MSAQRAEGAWKYSPDPTIERVWRAREALEREAGGDVRKLLANAARRAEEALRPTAGRARSG